MTLDPTVIFLFFRTRNKQMELIRVALKRATPLFTSYGINNLLSLFYVVGSIKSSSSPSPPFEGADDTD